MKHFSFLIVTTANLPEAYYLAQFLLERGQQVSILNIKDRTLPQKLRVLLKILKRRGIFYVCDLALGKLFTNLYRRQDVVPFPELDRAAILRLQKRCRVHNSDDVHGHSSQTFAASCAPDYMLVAGAPVLKLPLIKVAKFGALNRHLGLAPLYRGSDCPLWALYASDFSNIGFTIHYVSEKVDGGDVLLQDRVQLEKGVSFSHFLARLQLKASQGYVAVLEKIIRDHKLSRESQAAGGSHYPPAGLRIIRGAYRNYQEALEAL